jgi:hypothetical protein
MVVSDLRGIGQIGTTIGLGLLFDTLIVRSFMMPSVAALLGRWFWWPLMVRPYPARRRPRAVSDDGASYDRTFDDMVTAGFPVSSTTGDSGVSGGHGARSTNGTNGTNGAYGPNAANGANDANGANGADRPGVRRSAHQ